MAANISKTRTRVTLERHFQTVLLLIYNADPVSDFIRDRSGLLNAKELRRLEQEHHYLLIAKHMEYVCWLRAKGRVKNLPQALGEIDAYDMIAYCLVFSLRAVLANLAGVDMVRERGQLTLTRMQFYLDLFAANDGKRLEVGNKAVATAFAGRVLNQKSRTGSDSLERINSVAEFAIHLLEHHEKELQALATRVELVYLGPSDE